MAVASSIMMRGNMLNKLELVLASLTVFFLPMNFLRHPHFYLTLGDVLALLCLGVMAINGTVRLRPLEEMTWVLIVGGVILFTFLMVGSLVNGDPLRGVIVGGQYIFTYIILAFLFFSRDDRQAVLLVKIFVGSIFLMCLHGIYMVHIDGSTDNTFVSGNGRWGGFVEHPNTAGPLIGLTLPLLLWLNAHAHIRLLWLLPIFAIFVYGVLMTGSNSGLIAIVYGLVFYFVATPSWRRLLIATGLVCTAIFLLSDVGQGYLPAVFQKRVLGAIETGDVSQAGTFLHRYDLVVEAIDMIEKSIFLGVGADQHRALSQWGHPVHNAYLLIWSEGGLFALIGFLLILLALLLTALRAARQSQGWITAVCALSIVSAFAFVLNGTAHPYARFRVAPVFLSVALCLNMIRRQQALRTVPRRTGSPDLGNSGLL